MEREREQPASTARNGASRHGVKLQQQRRRTQVFGEAIGSFCETLRRLEHGLSNELRARRRASDATLR